ncbi:helix-turn-helix domain-containing protein [Tessaracoccus oleiagri]|uniref:Helix-turn-helix domain-containing protein n=1 Tax=Tessaracoccus oleiagri TaxID=686624 RepID=A0A1G9I2M2_9ACTN|nr:helix-turn-helix domain-containing protein [Tessaracoccus oleiagri]SDL19497.1 Helix-turn-helix domain-containing protein [Tessaracoccus oleiagri]
MARTESTAHLVLHPVRLRIIQTLLGGRRLTTGQIAKELDDVTTATLYRQVATLAEAGILDVVGERRIRGAVERTYELHVEASQLSPEELAKMTPDEHRQAFAAFVSGLLATFEAYTRTGDVDLYRDRIGYRQAALWLTDEELDKLVEDLRAEVARRAHNQPGRGRKRRLLSTIMTLDRAQPTDD